MARGRWTEAACKLCEGCGGDFKGADLGVVVQHEDAVRGAADVGFNEVSVLVDGGLEGGHRVFWGGGGCAAVGSDERDAGGFGHRQRLAIAMVAGSAALMMTPLSAAVTAIKLGTRPEEGKIFIAKGTKGAKFRHGFRSETWRIPSRT